MRRPDRQLLEAWADTIDMVLTANKIQARVVGGVVTPRLVRYRLLLGWGTKPEEIMRLEMSVANRLGMDQVRVAQSNGQLCVEVPRRGGETISLYVLCKRMDDIPRQTAVLGMGETGRALLLHLPSPDVGHALVAGTTGSGKTALARSIALSLAMHNRQGEIQLAILDPKGRGYTVLSGVPHLLCPIITEAGRVRHFLETLVQEMLARDKREACEPRIVVVIDEMADLIEAGGPDVLTAITRLTQRGREAGIHVVGCTQKPTADSIGSLVKSNFPVRLVGSVPSPEDAKVASGLKGTGAEKLLGRGDFLLVVKGQTKRFQAAYADTRTAQAIVARMAQGGRQSRRWLTEYPLESSPAALPDPDPKPDRPSRWLPRVVVDNRPDKVEQDALKVLDQPGWAERWIEGGGRFRYGYQSEIGRIIGQENAGAGRKHILAVAARILQRNNSTSTTPTALTESAEKPDVSAVGG